MIENDGTVLDLAVLKLIEGNSLSLLKLRFARLPIFNTMFSLR